MEDFDVTMGKEKYYETFIGQIDLREKQIENSPMESLTLLIMCEINIIIKKIHTLSHIFKKSSII